MKKLCIVFIAIIILSCQSNNESQPALSFPREYYNHQIKTTTKVRVFTKSGEIKDENVIKSFALRNGDGKLFYDGETKTEQATDTIVFLSSSEVKTSRSKEANIKAEIKGNNVKLIPLDTTRFISDYPIDEKDIKIAVLKNKPTLIFKGMVPTANGLKYSYEKIEYFFALIDDQSLTIPFLNYIIKSGDTQGHTSTQSIGLTNSFDDTSYKFLQQGDTLGVQEKVWLFKKV